MIFLYTLLQVILTLAKAMVTRKAARLEKRYVQAALSADRLLKESGQKSGNGSKADLYKSAKLQYHLGQLVEQRDRYEARYSVWQTRADRLSAVVSRVRAWKGRKLPYLLGAADVLVVLGTLEYLGYGEYASVKQLAQRLTEVLAG